MTEKNRCQTIVFLDRHGEIRILGVKAGHFEDLLFAGKEDKNVESNEMEGRTIIGWEIAPILG